MKHTLKKAGKTFIQAAIGYLATNFILCAGRDFADIQVLKTVLICVGVSALAAGLAAVMNLPKKEEKSCNQEESDPDDQQ